LDRDGTINEDVGYPRNFDQIKIFSWSFEAIRKIRDAGFLAIIITNQSGIGRGYFTETDLEDIHRKMSKVFEKKKASFDAIYYCPHYSLSSLPQYRKECDCRKPGPGMGLKAARELQIDITRSYVIGDKVEDVLFGWNIQATPILVLTGAGKEARKALIELGKAPAFVARNLLEAVNWICQRGAKKEARSKPEGWR
jgi:D-glycero-D-manno-heptose 1,7-bisphosphate phosphatase